MKKHFYLVLFLAIIISGCEEKGDERILMSNLQKCGELYCLNGKPFTGFSFEMWNETQLKAEGKYEDGKEVGVWKFYHENGRLSFEGEWKDKKRVGLWKEYFANGKLMYEGEYKDGKEIGLWKAYFENGQIESEGEYREGEKVGLWREYFYDGQLKEEKNIK